MKSFIKLALASILSVVALSSAAFAEHHKGHHKKEAAHHDMKLEKSKKVDAAAPAPAAGTPASN